MMKFNRLLNRVRKTVARDAAVQRPCDGLSDVAPTTEAECVAHWKQRIEETTAVVENTQERAQQQIKELLEMGSDHFSS